MHGYHQYLGGGGGGGGGVKYREGRMNKLEVFLRKPMKNQNRVFADNDLPDYCKTIKKILNNIRAGVAKNL